MNSNKKMRHLSEKHKINISNALKGRIHSQEEINKLICSRKKLFNEKKLVSPMQGKHHSLETREKIRLSHIGKKLSEEHKLKLRDSHLGKKHPMSEETKKKIGIANLGIRNSQASIQKRKDTISKKSIEEKEQSKKKYSETRKRLHSEGKLVIWCKGKNLSKEHINKLRLAHIGKKLKKEITSKWGEKRKEYYKNHPELIEKLRQRMLLHNPFKGKKHTEQSKKLMGLAHIGRKVSIEQIKKITEIWNRPEYKEIAKKRRAKQILPMRDSSIEIKIQKYLKDLGIEFFTHQYIHQINHAYQCDILIPSMNIVIEADGMYWHKYPIMNDIDHVRTKELIEKGFKVLRLWEYEIKLMKNAKELKYRMDLL